MASNDKEQAGDSKGDTTNLPTNAGPPDDRQTQLPKMDALPLPTAPGQNGAKSEADTIIPGSRDPQITNTFDSGNDVALDSKCFVNDEVADRTRKVRYFGDYELLSEIARGGMGVVYKACQVNLNRIVALKMILAGQLASDEEVQRFRSEAEAAANLDHPGIVPIFEIGQHEGLHFFSMGYVDGCSLADRVRNGPLPPREAAELVRKVAEAISYAHGRNVIHRDLKPANVLLDQSGEPKVTDFGLARRMDSDSGMTKTGAVMGTPSYMPPEQAAGKTSEVGPWSDVYSLGAILYCLLTGRPPFQAANPLDTILQVMERDPVSVSTINPEIQRDLETICHKCLQKEPAKRYASAQDFADDLGRWLRGEPIAARAISGTERVWRWVKRNRAVSGLIAGTVAAILLGSAFSLWYGIAAMVAERKARTSEAKAVRTLARSDYYLALARWDQNRAAEAREILNRIPPDHRNLEWGLAAEQFTGSDLFLGPTSDAVMSVAFSPDGNRVVSGGGSFEAPADMVLWSTVSGNALMTLKGHEGIVSCVAFSPDGARLVSGSYDKTLKLWDVTTGEELGTINGHDGIVSCVAFSPDGARLVSGSYDKTLKLWDATTGEELGTLNGHDGNVVSVAFSPNGSQIVSGSWDKTIKLWDAATEEELRTIKGHKETCISVAFSPDNSRLVSAGQDGTMRLWDAMTGQEIRTTRAWVDHVAFSPDGSRIAGSWDQTIRLWDAATGDEIRTLKGHETYINSIAFSPDGFRLVSAAGESGKSGEIRLWDAASGDELQTLKGHQDAVLSISISPDGTQILSGSWDQTAKLWDAVTAEEIRTLKGHDGKINSVAFSPNGHQVVSGSEDQTIKLWNTGTGAEIRTFSGHTGRVNSVAFSPNGHQVVSGSEDQTIKLWDTEMGAEMRTFAGHAGGVKSISFSPDGSRIVSGGADNVLKLWDASTGKAIRTLRGHNRSVDSVSFSPNGSQIVSGSWDETIKLWDAATGEELLTIRGHKFFVCSVAFSPDCSRIISGSGDGTVRVWDSTSGEELLALEGHQHNVQSVTLSPDGFRIASGSSDTTIRIWESVFYPRQEQSFRNRFAAPQLKWHEEQARSFEKSGNEFAASFHRARYQTLDPK